LAEVGGDMSIWEMLFMLWGWLGEDIRVKHNGHSQLRFPIRKQD